MIKRNSAVHVSAATSISPPLFKPLLRVYYEKGHVLGDREEKMEGSAE